MKGTAEQNLGPPNFLSHILQPLRPRVRWPVNDAHKKHKDVCLDTEWDEEISHLILCRVELGSTQFLVVCYKKINHIKINKPDQVQAFEA